MTTEPNTAQSIVDGQLAELQITDKEVVAVDYKQSHALKIQALWEEAEQLPDITDKATLQANQDVLTKLTRARTGIDKWRKAWKEPWKKIADQVDTYLGTNRDSGLQAKIAAIEDKVEAKKKAYLDEQAKAQREAERLLEERYNERVGKLMAIGMAFEPNGNLTIRHGEETATATKEQIRFATDEQMAGALQRAEVIAEKIAEAAAAAQQAKEAEERERQEEAARLAAQKREQDEKEAKLAKERADFEREKEEMADHRAATRAAELVACGATAHGYGPAAMRYEIGDVIVGHGELRHMDPETWIATRERVRDAKVKAIEEQKEWDAQMKRAADRGEELRALGAEQYEDGAWHLGVVEGDPDVTQLDLRTMTSDQWAVVLARFKEAAEARDRAPSTTGYVIDDDVHQLILPAEERNRMDSFVKGKMKEVMEQVYNEPHNAEEYRADVAKAAEIIAQEGSAVVGAQPDIPRDEFNGEPLTVESAIFQALGEASMCWDPRPTGIFDSTRCKDVSDRLVATLKKMEAVNFGE